MCVYMCIYTHNNNNKKYIEEQTSMDVSQSTQSGGRLVFH